MNRIEDNTDGLKLLFDGMPVEKLPDGFNSRLMERVHAAACRRARRREKLGEILLLSIIAVVSITGLFLTLRHFSPSATEELPSASATLSETMSNLGSGITGMLDRPSMAPLTEYANSPIFGLSIFIAIAILLLLVLDSFMRKVYANRHSIEL